MSFGEDIKNTVSERMRSPFWGPYLLAWFSFNWRAVLYWLDDDLSGGDRRHAIESLYASCFAVVESFGYPFFAAIFIVLLHRLLSRKYENWVIGQKTIDIDKDIALAAKRQVLNEKQADVNLEPRKTALRQEEEKLEKKKKEFEELRASVIDTDKKNRERARSYAGAFETSSKRLDGAIIQLCRIRRKLEEVKQQQPLSESTAAHLQDESASVLRMLREGLSALRSALLATETMHQGALSMLLDAYKDSSEGYNPAGATGQAAFRSLQEAGLVMPHPVTSGEWQITPEGRSLVDMLK